MNSFSAVTMLISGCLIGTTPLMAQANLSSSSQVQEVALRNLGIETLLAKGRGVLVYSDSSTLGSVAEGNRLRQLLGYAPATVGDSLICDSPNSRCRAPQGTVLIRINQPGIKGDEAKVAVEVYWNVSNEAGLPLTGFRFDSLNLRRSTEGRWQITGGRSGST